MSRPLSELISNDAQDALAGANSPGASNVFVTADDIADLAPLDEQIRLALEQSNGASETNVFATINDLPTPESFPQPPTNIYIDPPTSPSAFDDEFNFGSADLAERAWLVVNTSFQTMSRVGDVIIGVSAFGGAPSAGLGTQSYRSSIIDSKLVVQVSDGVDMFIYRAVSGLQATYALRAKSSLPGNNQAVAVCVVRDNPATKGFAANNNRHAWSGYHVASDQPRLRSNIGGDTYSNVERNVSADCPVDLHVLRLQGEPTKVVTSLHIDSRQQMPMYVQRVLENSPSMTFGYAGIRLIATYSSGNFSNSAGQGLFVIDYIRRMDVSLVPWFGEY